MPEDREHGDEIDRLTAMLERQKAQEKWMVAENARLAEEREQLLAERERLKARLRAVLRAKGIENPN